MQKEIENPNAFPVLDSGFWQPGMQLMDYYAAKAMQSLLSQPNIGGILRNLDPSMTQEEADAALCQTSYRIAAAMLKARQKIKS